MLLYTFTTEGSSREDGNVYYANFLIVDALESDKALVDAAICNFLGVTKSDVVLDMYREMGITNPQIRAQEESSEPKDMIISSDDLEERFGEDCIDIDEDMLNDLATVLNTAGWKTVKPVIDYITVNVE